MLLFDGAAGLLLLALWLFCLVDVIITNEYACRNLPKLLWLLIVLVLPDIGSLLWLILGRPQGARSGITPASTTTRGSDPRGSSRSAHVTNPDDDEEFMAQVRLRAEQQRQRAREQRRDQTPPPGAGDNPAQPDAG
mgnify:FL=1